MTRPTQRMLDWQWQEKIGLKDRKTLDGHQSVYFNRLMDLAQPVEENDAVTKKYTDDLFNQLLGGILDMFEFDINGNLLINANALPLPTGASEAAKQDIGNASLASIDYKAYKGKDRTTTTGAAEELTIPASSKRVIISCAPSTQAYVEINGNATTSSPLYLEDPFGPLILDLGSVTKLSAYVVAGNLGAVFYG